MMRGVADRISAAMGGVPVRCLERLHGGCVAEVYRAELDGAVGAVVAKVGGQDGAALDTEAMMLRTLAERGGVPVPRVLYSAADLLVTEFVEGESRFTSGAERHAAELLAELHRHVPPAPHGACFGFDRDTLIGPLRQPNPWTGSWVAFFAEQRLRHFGEVARSRGRLPAGVHARLERIAGRLGELIDEPPTPALVHGDVWTTNVLARGDRIVTFLDPAVHYAHPEVELAFITLFNTFSGAFFERYREVRGEDAPGLADEGFFRTRRHVYNLYPLLVHAILFGGGYAEAVDESLGQLGV